ncbi:MAG: type I polyketide synthase [Candidatus Acidiferrales bacterium]
MAPKDQDREQGFDGAGRDLTEHAQDNDAREPIAIVGIGCRFPGGANCTQSFWRLLCDEIDAISEMPLGRFDINAYYDPQPATPGKIITRNGGFLRDIELFDASFFGISPREADFLDPQQRLLLEVAWEALEDGGIVPGTLVGSRTGVFIGEWANDYEDAIYEGSDRLDLYTITGGGRYPASGRLSYFFDFRGPSVTVDTACSSSSVAVHLACKSLWNGEIPLALAGGVNLIVTPQISIAFSFSGMLSPDGRCKFGDAGANGFVRSDGAGVLVLKTLSQARVDGNPIYALIRGSAVNNDGRGSDLLVAPSENGQAAMLRAAYQDAGISPGRVGYVEAHGTGTSVGDPVEIQALGAVLAEGRAPGSRCSIGSVKTNIGHSEGAAGVAGIIKAALCLKHRIIPRSLHFREPSPKIPWTELPLAIQIARGEWPADGRPAIAGASAFGITGTNAHVVLEEATRAPADGELSREESDRETCLVPLSAHSPEALKELARANAELLRSEEPFHLSDFTYSHAIRRTHHDYRLTVVAHSRRECAEQLEVFQRGEPSPAVTVGDPDANRKLKVVFVFPGQGSQWFGMGRQLIEREPAFRDSMRRCDEVIRSVVDWSLLEQLALPDTSPSYRLREIDVIQPALVAIEISLAALWRSWGVEPDAVIGHSMGEVAAACVAGALTFEDAFRVICLRSRLLRRMSGRGAMALVELSFDGAREALKGYEDRVSIAVSNSPRSTVLSGDPSALDEILPALEARGIFCRLVRVDVASHSPQMDSLLPELGVALAGLEPRAASIPIYSTVSGEFLAGSELTADYWVKNLRQPVLFGLSIQGLLADGHDAFIEMSPQPILLPAIEQTAQEGGRKALTLASLRRDEPEQETILSSLGALYAAAYPLDWTRLYPEGRFIRLPLYPWQRHRCWFEAPGAKSKKFKHAHAGKHPLLGERFVGANGTEIWQTALSTETEPYLQDHRVRGRVFFPAAGFVEMALAAAVETFGSGAHQIESVELKEAMVLADSVLLPVQFVLSRSGTELATFQVFAGSAGGHDPQSWILHATGKIRVWQSAADFSQDLRSAENIANLSEADGATPGNEFYEALEDRSYEYGPGFRGVSCVRRTAARAFGELSRPEILNSAAGPYQIHPALLDACFQLLLATDENGTNASGDFWLPTRIDRVQLAGPVRYEDNFRAVAIRHEDSQDLVGDVFLLRDGVPVLAVHGFRCQRVRSRPAEEIRQWLYATQWKPSALAAVPSPRLTSAWLLIAERGDEAAAQLAASLRSVGDRVTEPSPGSEYRETSREKFETDLGRAEHFAPLLQAAFAGTADDRRGIIYLCGASAKLNSASTESSLGTALERDSMCVLRLVQALGQAAEISLRVWLVMRGSQEVVAGESKDIRIEQAPLWGLGGVIALEHPEWRCTRVDLGAVADAKEIHALVAELQSDSSENQLALRAGDRYVARLTPFVTEEKKHASPRKRAQSAGEGYQLEIRKPGLLDDLALFPVKRRLPGSGEVEIEIHAAGLNFIDVMKAMRIYPGLDPEARVALGAECTGTITAVGPGVLGFRCGDEVIAITASYAGMSLFANYVTIPEKFVLRKPASLSFEQAASLPLAYLTAHYALNELGRMRAGERVLIHSAAGGVGMAAIHLARAAGAEIFATVGSPEKRTLLQKMGVAHVMDSHSIAFAAEILALTNGEGVDIVLNSLAGEAIPASFSVLRAHGRFLEIGKRDIYENTALGMASFKKNISFFAIDLAEGIEQRPELFEALLSGLLKRIVAGDLPPLPVTVRSIGEASEAFRLIAQGGHTGKVVLRIKNETVQLTVPADDGIPIRADGSYLISGGLGDLGLTTAEWLVERGAKHIALISRSTASASAQVAIAKLQAAGAEITVLQADAARFDSVSRAVKEIEKKMPPLRGVIHAAGILDDATLQKMNEEQFRRVMAPKVGGAWNLHTLTRTASLDFFVLFSSVAGVLGSPGQGNYAAANAFLDALAHWRRAQGLPALSIDWGPWARVGLAARQSNRGMRLANRGLGSFSPEHGRAALELLLGQTTTQVAVMKFGVHKWCEFHPGAAAPFFSDLNQPASEKPGKLNNIRVVLAAAESGEAREQLLTAYVCEQVGHVLRLAPSKIPLNKPFKTLGLDSLMTMELRNRLDSGLGLKLSAAVIWNHPTVQKLVPFLLGRMQIAGAETREHAETGAAGEISLNEENLPQADGGREAQIDHLTQDEVASLLEAELSSIDRRKRKERGRTETER